MREWIDLFEFNGEIADNTVSVQAPYYRGNIEFRHNPDRGTVNQMIERYEFIRGYLIGQDVYIWAPLVTFEHAPVPHGGSREELWYSSDSLWFSANRHRVTFFVTVQSGLVPLSDDYEANREFQKKIVQRFPATMNPILAGRSWSFSNFSDPKERTSLN